jgi:hypothetical protein
MQGSSCYFEGKWGGMGGEMGKNEARKEMNSKTVTSINISSNTSISSTSLSISGKACYLHPGRRDIDDVYDTYDACLLLDDICHNNYDKKEDEWIDIIHYNSQHEEGEGGEEEEEEKEERKRDIKRGEPGDEGMKEEEKEEAWDMRYGDIQRIENEEKEREIKLR